MSKKLIVDLDILRNCDNDALQCSYNKHAKNQGVVALGELAIYELVCRRCEERSCVLACPMEALEANDRGVLVRHNLRCVACQSCLHACPFGTMLTDVITLHAGSCDMCPQLQSGQAPLCATSCTNGAVAYEDVPDPLPADMYSVKDSFVVRSKHWKKIEDGVAPKA